MNKTLTQNEAYLEIFSFLEDYYARTKSDEIGSMLSGMCLMSDGKTMDPAYSEEWKATLQRALEGNVDAEMRFE